METLMNEENKWDHRISAGVKEGPADWRERDPVSDVDALAALYVL